MKDLYMNDYHTALISSLLICKSSQANQNQVFYHYYAIQ